MTPDPFETLREPPVAVDPDPTFTATLRARLARALDLPRGVTVSDLQLDDHVPAATMPLRPTRAVITPYLAVTGAAGALDWYVTALDARLRGDPIAMPDGRIGHAEIEIGGALVMLADAHPEIDFTAPEPGRGSAVTLHLEVDDVDTVIGRAVDAGAGLERPPQDSDHGRSGAIIDPYGHRWLISASPVSVGTDTGDATPTTGNGRAEGDLAYVTMEVVDSAKARAFYGSVLGWRWAAGNVDDGWQVEATTPMTGLSGGHDVAAIVPMYRVDDIATAVRAVREAGGAADDPQVQPYGTMATCTDDQGSRFYLGQL